MGNPLKSFFESMSGTSKQSYGASLYDAKEMKKWKGEQDKWYKDLGDTRDRYGRQSSNFMGRYDRAEGEADRYRGKAEAEFGSARRSMGRADSSFGRSQADINRARQSQSSANAMMADRDHYSNLARNAEERRQGIKGDRLQMQSLRGRLGKPAQDTGMTQRLMDAFKGSNESSREMMEANTAQLAKVNPVAAARMQAQFNEGTLKSLGQLKQQGMVTDQQLGDNNLTREAGMLMDSTSLYGQEAAQDQMQAGYHQQQIQNYGAAGTQALNTAGAEGNIARGQLSQASQYANLGGQYGNMGSQLDARAGRALGAGMQYEGMGYQALQDQTSISNRRVERQDKFRMSDAAARSRVDSFNNSRANMGLQNTLGVIRTGVEVAGAFATGGTSLYASAAVRAAEAAAKEKGKSNNPKVTRTVGPPGREYGSSVSKPSFNSNAYTPMTMDGSSAYNPHLPMEGSNYREPYTTETPGWIQNQMYTGQNYESYGTGYQPMQNPTMFSGGMFDTGALGRGKRGVKKWWEKQNASNYQQPNYGAY
jgi:hypothetical protein